MLLSLQEVLDRLLRDPAAFQERLRQWMQAIIHAVLSMQQSSVLRIDRLLDGNGISSHPTVPALPLGPNERRYCQADGGVETATAEEITGEKDGEDRTLFYYRPGSVDEQEAWPEATRLDLPLRNKKGEVVDKEAWTKDYDEEKKAFWTAPANSSALGTAPSYRLPESAHFRGAMPAQNQGVTGSPARRRLDQAMVP